MGIDTSFILKIIATVIAACFILFLIFIVLIQTYESIFYTGQSPVMWIVFYAFIVIVVLEILAMIGIWRNPFVGGIGFILLGLIWFGIWFSFGWESFWIVSSIFTNISCGILSLVVWGIEKKKITIVEET